MLYGLSAGVIASFTMFGYAQEAVTRTPFGPDNLLFKFSTFLVLVQSIGNAIVAAAMRTATTLLPFARAPTKAPWEGNIDSIPTYASRRVRLTIRSKFS